MNKFAQLVIDITLLPTVVATPSGSCPNKNESDEILIE